MYKSIIDAYRMGNDISKNEITNNEISNKIIIRKEDLVEINDCSDTQCIVCNKIIENDDSKLYKIKQIETVDNFVCLDCEIKTCPERFHGCAFCRKPLRYYFACSTCRLGFNEWIEDNLPDDTISKCMVNNAKKIVESFSESGFIQNREFIYDNNDDKDKFNFQTWKGFYAGMCNINELVNMNETNMIYDSSNNNNELITYDNIYLPVWIKPTMLINTECNNLLKLSNIKNNNMFENAVLGLLKNNGIDLCGNVQFNIDYLNIENGNSYKVYIYEL